MLMVEGEMFRPGSEVFGEADLDAALARFEELERLAPLLANPSTRVWVRIIDAVDPRRNMDGLLALGSPDGLFEDRRKGLRDVVAGPEQRQCAPCSTVPSSWRVGGGAHRQ